jgi:spore coat protein U-like protein
MMANANLSRHRIKCRLLIAQAFIGALVALSQAAAAKTGTTTFNVTANVPSACTITASDLAFGAVDANPAANVDAQTTLNVTCTLGTTYSIALDKGLSSTGTVAMRQMQNGTNKLNYTLYTTTARTTVWGDGTLSTSTSNGTGTGNSQALTVYGRVPSGQSNLAAGNFSDTITATITY